MIFSCKYSNGLPEHWVTIQLVEVGYLHYTIITNGWQLPHYHSCFCITVKKEKAVNGFSTSTIRRTLFFWQYAAITTTLFDKRKIYFDLKGGFSTYLLRLHALSCSQLKKQLQICPFTIIETAIVKFLRCIFWLIPHPCQKICIQFLVQKHPAMAGIYLILCQL